MGEWNVWQIGGLGLLLSGCLIVFSISSSEKESFFMRLSAFVIFISIILMISFAHTSEGYIDIANEIDKIGDVCIDNKKGILTSKICANKQECVKLNNIIAYREIKILDKTQSIYLIPYQPQKICNNNDNNMILNKINSMKKDFTILIK